MATVASQDRSVVSLGMLSPDGLTPFAELNDLVVDLASRARAIMGNDLVGAYLQGSFALGDADEHSDCDFVIVVADRLTAEQESALRALHDEIPTRDGQWCQRLQGSYAPATDLRHNDRIGTRWLYVGHGSRTMQWLPHCNTVVVRWILREHGVTVVGPPPSDLVVPISADMLRENARTQLLGFLDHMCTWAWPFRVAWTQRYLVATYCRILYRLANGEVASKAVALQWAMDTLDPAWRPLLTQVLADRVRGTDFGDRARPGSIKSSLRFAAYAVSLVDVEPRLWSATRAGDRPGLNPDIRAGWLGVGHRSGAGTTPGRVVAADGNAEVPAVLEVPGVDDPRRVAG